MGQEGVALGATLRELTVRKRKNNNTGISLGACKALVTLRLRDLWSDVLGSPVAM